jgi:hypothetical protein
LIHDAARLRLKTQDRDRRPEMGSERSRFSPDEVQVLSHPIRLRIVELFTDDPDRSLAVADLTADLGDGFAGVTAGQVNYHLRYLQRAGWIPVLAWG